MNEEDTMFTQWSYVHVVSGMTLGILRWERWKVYLILIVFEFFEQLTKKGDQDMFGQAEDSSNTTMDLLLGIGGYELGRWGMNYAEGRDTARKTLPGAK